MKEIKAQSTRQIKRNVIKLQKTTSPANAKQSKRKAQHTHTHTHNAKAEGKKVKRLTYFFSAYSCANRCVCCFFFFLSSRCLLIRLSVAYTHRNAKRIEHRERSRPSEIVRGIGYGEKELENARNVIYKANCVNRVNEFYLHLSISFCPFR